MRKIRALFVFLALCANAQALPVDMRGRLLFDSHYLGKYRKMAPMEDSKINAGAMIPKGNNHKNENANFQTYLFQLQPQIIVNDAVTVFSELSGGYAGGGIFGDSTRYRKSPDSGFGDALFLQNYSGPGVDNSVYFSQIYAELYADTATFMVGKHAYHWGLGAIYNSGPTMGQRFRTIRNGFTIKFKLGNFLFEPFWDKSSMHGSLTTGSSTRTWGASAVYANLEKDMTLGLLLAKRSANIEDSFYTSANTQGPLGGNDVKIIDLYFKKTWDFYTLGIEVPMLSGSLGKVYRPTLAAPNLSADATYDAKAYIVQNDFKTSDFWKFILHGAMVTGNAGDGPAYKAMYLHPNFQMANILFRYNHQAITDQTQSVFDSYLTNALVLKTGANYNNDLWDLDFFVIWAKALEVARANGKFYNHQLAKVYDSGIAQDKNMGLEIDINARYHWNANLQLFAQVGHLFTGKYFAYNIDSTVATKNEFSFMGGMGIEF